MVGAARFELATLCSQSRCATRLRYAPTFSKNASWNASNSLCPTGAYTHSHAMGKQDNALGAIKYAMRDLITRFQADAFGCAGNDLEYGGNLDTSRYDIP